MKITVYHGLPPKKESNFDVRLELKIKRAVVEREGFYTTKTGGYGAARKAIDLILNHAGIQIEQLEG